MAYIGTQPLAGQYRKLDDISSGFNGATTSFTTSVGGTNVTAGSPQQLLVSLGGVIQQPTVDYTVNTSTITFTTAPASGLSFFAVLMGDALNTSVPADGSITSAKLAGSLSVGLAAGSASTPSLFFTGDTNTGIYSPGADQVALTTAGTARLYVSSAGLVGIGSTAPNAKLVVSNGGANGIEFYPESPANTNTIVSYNRSTSLYRALRFEGSDYSFTNGSTAFVNIDSSGRLLVGTSSNSGVALLTVQGYAGSASGEAIAALRRDATPASAGTSIGVINFDNTANSLGAQIFAASDGGWTNGSSHPTRLAFATTASGASSPTERMRITNDGYILLGKTLPGFGASSDNDGVTWDHANKIFAVQSASNPPIVINRRVNDGSLIDFYQSQSLEGSISVSGTTVSYNGAHLSRWSQIPGIDPHDKDARPVILRGTVMSNLDEMCDWIDPESGDAQDNEQLNKTKISDVEGDKNVAGIFQSWDDDDDTWVNDYYLAMTGDFIIRIAAGTSVERGDLLMSAGDGTAKPQDDDIIRSKTIAKVTSTNVSCTYEDGSYCVPCVLMAC